MGNAFTPPPRIGVVPNRIRIPRPGEKLEFEEHEWKNDGLQWDQSDQRHCIILDIEKALGKTPHYPSSDSVWYEYEKKVFRKICHIIRKREAQINDGIVPHERQFYENYSFSLDPGLKTKCQTREIINILKFTFQESNHQRKHGISYQWHGDKCVIHSIPSRIIHSELNPNIPNDVIIQDRFEKIHSWEFEILKQHLRQVGHQRLRNVNFIYDGPWEYDNVNLKEEANEWEKMWRASEIGYGHRVSNAKDNHHHDHRASSADGSAIQLQRVSGQRHMDVSKHKRTLATSEPALQHNATNRSHVNGPKEIDKRAAAQESWAKVRQRFHNQEGQALRVNRDQRAAEVERKSEILDLDTDFEMFTDTNHP